MATPTTPIPNHPALALTVADIEAGYQHESHDDCPGYGGFGYLGERQSAADHHNVSVADIARSDAAVLAYANEHGWNDHRLFDWLNSRDGRHFADQSLHSGDAGIARAIGWGLLPGVLGRPFGR
jgi:hypothetical protein